MTVSPFASWLITNHDWRTAQLVIAVLAWVVLVAFLAKFEVFGGFWARWTIGG